MKKILNVSNHTLTQEQITDLKNKYGEIELLELPEDLKRFWSKLTPNNYQDICEDIDEYINNEFIDIIHLAGFTPAVVYLIRINEYLIDEGEIKFIYSYSERISEEKEVNGEVIKTSIFKHKGWYNY